MAAATKRATTKKAAPRKSVAKKAATKKAAAGKTAAKKAATKKTAAKKVAAKTAVAKKAVAKKVPAKKLAAKTAAKKAASPDDASIAREFRAVVNMSADAIDRWLGTKESRVVGAKDGVTGTSEGGPESVGHRSGRRIIGLLRKDGTAYNAGDYAHMRKVVGYVRRHLAQRPASEDIASSRWRYSLMNWGHDPLHDGG